MPVPMRPSPTNPTFIVSPLPTRASHTDPRSSLPSVAHDPGWLRHRDRAMDPPSGSMRTDPQTTGNHATLSRFGAARRDGAIETEQHRLLLDVSRAIATHRDLPSLLR